MKKIIQAKSAGFCFGVSRAVDTARTAVCAGSCYCLGDIIHNRDVVADLKRQGMITANTPEDIPEGARVIIRSHGAGPDTYSALEKKHAEVIDATCPRVSHIHQLIRAAENEGRLPVIIGAEDHPEVAAMRGWAAASLVFPDGPAFAEWLDAAPENPNRAMTVVFQTTQTQKNLEFTKNLIKKLCTNTNLFDTICRATFKRQEEAEQLSYICDAMVVIGGKHSANSLHLAEICSQNCRNVQFVENADELDISRLSVADTIGITAGASTPAWIIKEVKQKMCDEIKIEEINNEVPAEVAPAAEKPDSEKTFDELLEESIKTIYNGETVTGIVAAINPTDISVDLGIKHSGYIPLSEFTDDPTVNVNDVVKVGDSIQAVVVRVNDAEGTVMLSKRRLDAVKNWDDIEAAKEEGTVVEGLVTEDNKGGIVVNVSGIRVFVPASQSGLPKEASMSDLLKQKVRLKITEVNRSRRRVVGSIRAVVAKERREKAEKIWNEIEVGKHYTGVVKSMTSYGAFVDIGGIDGMVHVSELSWSRVRQPSDVLTVGQEIDVYVISFDKENHKISLGHKDPNENPWVKFTTNYQVGDIANVTIVKLMPFGAFAEIIPGVDGLIHISQIANRRIGKPDEVLTAGETVDAKITAIDEEKHKVSLSIRAVSEPAPAPAAEEEPAPVHSHAPEGDALVYEVSATGEATGVAPETDAE